MTTLDQENVEVTKNVTSTEAETPAENASDDNSEQKKVYKTKTEAMTILKKTRWTI